MQNQGTVKPYSARPCPPYIPHVLRVPQFYREDAKKPKDLSIHGSWNVFFIHSLMAEQHYKNHSRVLPIWHFFGGILLLAFLVGSIIFLCRVDPHMHFQAVLFLIASVLMILLWIYARAFALKAQDRAIRAEENFRHYLLTGKPLDSRLRLGQIIALRFAPDEEFPALAQKAVNEKLSQKQIKQAIRNWRPDYYRV